MRTAVLFLVFNRPDTTAQVFDAIRSARPPRLYIAADGPRPSCQGEAIRCEEVRRIATAVDWPCEVKTLLHDQNLGCMMGPVSGINWFFDNEEEGIILEDDVLPVPTFFLYCDELLARYRNDNRVAIISGNNLISHHFAPQESYFFSRYNHIWGWASWRRAWRLYDVHMNSWPSWRDRRELRRISGGDRLFERYWQNIFDDVHCGRIDSAWDYQWTFACWLHGMLSALPAQNQCHNIGFGRDATHTTSDTPDFVKESVPKPLQFPLIHPIRVERVCAADALIGSKVFSITTINIIKRVIREAPIVGDALVLLRRFLEN